MNRATSANLESPLSEGQAKSWYLLSVDESANALETSEVTGLTDREAERRLSQFGSNQIADSETRRWPEILAAQLKSSLVVLLVAAAAISIALGEFTDSIAVIAIIFLNTFLGFWQDYSAEKSLAEIRKLSAPEATVFRGGVLKAIPASELVPGDLVSLKAGYFAPADGRIVEQSNLSIDESVLTGESVSVSKGTDPVATQNLDSPTKAGIVSSLSLGDRTNMAFAGTTVVRGRGMAIVTETGMRTEIGKVAKSLQNVKLEPTPLQTKLGQLSRSLAVIAVVVVILVFIAGLLSGQPLKLMLMTALSMAVAIVPEGLPAVATVALAIGARKMFRRNALIRQLPAVETLGSVSVICSDKTGTLTQNKMTVTLLDVANCRVETENHRPLNQDLRSLLLGACLCNDAQLQPSPGDVGNVSFGQVLDMATSAEPNGKHIAVGEPTERALVEVAANFGVNQIAAAEQMPRIAEVPFSSQRKRMTTVHSVEKLATPIFGPDVDAVAFCKGAVDRVLEISSQVHIGGEPVPLSRDHTSRIRRSRDEMASRGNRVLAVAIRLIRDMNSVETRNLLQQPADLLEHEMVFVGLIGMKDPPRPEAADAVEKCKSAGIRPIMITGDHPLTALNIASQIGIESDGNAISGADLEQMSADELGRRVQDVSVFARVAPADKLNIVEALERQGEVVAMTGDGVNDAPALKQANVGVAMGIAGTDVAKQAANMVLLDDNFSTIVAAVEQGRTVYDNIRKFVKYTMSSNIGEVFVMTIGVLFGMPLPLLPLQILWVNLVTDGLPGLAMAVEPTERDAMRRPPLPLSEPIFNRRMMVDLVWIGSLIGLASLGTAFLLADPAENVDQWRTIVFTVLTLAQMANVFACRSEQPIYRLGHLFTNRWLWFAVASTFLLQLAVIYWPPMQGVFHTTSLSLVQMGVCLASSLLVLVMIELGKRFLYRPQPLA